MQPLCLLVVLSCLGVVFSAPNSKLERDVRGNARLTPSDMIEKHGYPSETHHVQTEDGYILEMHRIPYGLAEGAGPKPNKPVVFLMHGLLSSSTQFVIIEPERGLGFLLADLGYDVWMGNARGSTYSRKHATLDPNKPKFWEFSWHEIGVYDLPAMIDYILNHTKQEKLFYIGHSQGTTVFYVMGAERPEYNGKIRAMFSLAPVAYLEHINPLLKFAAQFEQVFEGLFKLLGIYEFLPTKQFLTTFGDEICNQDSLTEICSNPQFIISRSIVNQMALEDHPVPRAFSDMFSTVSVNQILHFAQNVKSGYFRQYDFRFIKNLIKYKKATPPKYDISKITAPVALMYSQNDIFTDEVDVMKLYFELPNPVGRFLVPDEKFSHVDFITHENVVDLVYNTIFSLMTKY